MFFRKRKPILDPASQERVVACIREAEQNTTGELRVFMEHKCKHTDAMDRAKEIFHKLGMQHTERRNAVLVYMAFNDRQFAIIGDKEIYEKAGGPVFWESAANKLRDHLKNGQIAEGLCVCINELGKALATHFPYDPSITKNELPDEIVFGK
jgi:uncharacterized membrane protein